MNNIFAFWCSGYFCNRSKGSRGQGLKGQGSKCQGPKRPRAQEPRAQGAKGPRAKGRNAKGPRAQRLKGPRAQSFPYNSHTFSIHKQRFEANCPSGLSHWPTSLPRERADTLPAKVSGISLLSFPYNCQLPIRRLLIFFWLIHFSITNLNAFLYDMIDLDTHDSNIRVLH